MILRNLFSQNLIFSLEAIDNTILEDLSGVGELVERGVSPVYGQTDDFHLVVGYFLSHLVHQLPAMLVLLELVLHLLQLLLLLQYSLLSPLQYTLQIFASLLQISVLYFII